MDYQQLLSAVLVEIRGQRTQGAVSKKLGFSYNQVYRWEAGRIQMKWSEFARVCSVCRVDLKKPLLETTGFRGVPDRIDLILKRLLGGSKAAVAAKVYGVSRFVLSDWLKGISEPPVTKIFGILDKRELLVPFLMRMVPIEKLPHLQREASSYEKKARLFREFPFSLAVALSLYLESYKRLPSHEEGFIASSLGISVEEEKALLELLEESGAVEKRDGKLQLKLDHFAMGGDFGLFKSMSLYWMKRSEQRLASYDEQPTEDIFSSQIYCTSPQAAEKIRAVIMDAFRDIRSIIEADAEPSESLQILNIQLFDPATKLKGPE